jgi:hypothetical protein
MRRGGYSRFIGGEAQWERHYAMGLVTYGGVADLGRFAPVELTPEGAALLDASGK